MREKIMYLLRKLKAKLLDGHYELKAQFTMYAMLMTVISIILYVVAVYPILDEILTESGIGGIEGDILGYCPLFILIFILWSGLHYVNPHRREK